MKVDEFIKWIYPQVKNGEISPVFVVAQAALESGWGKSAIGNNLFGITKGSSWNGKTKLVMTTEYFSTSNIHFVPPEYVSRVIKISDKRYKYIAMRLFRDYDNVYQCLSDHLSILRKPQFADAWPYRKNPSEYVRRLQDCINLKYATDPNYVTTMDRLFIMVTESVKKQKL